MINQVTDAALWVDTWNTLNKNSLPCVGGAAHGGWALSGPVAGSVFCRELHGSSLHLVARQLRIHDSTDVVWFTSTASPPIIEDCSAMLFAPYTAAYPALKNQVLARD